MIPSTPPHPDPAPPPDRAPAAGGTRSSALAFASMLAALAVFFAPAILTDEQFLFRDNGRMHWPVKQYIAEQLRRGHLPEWNPYNSFGAPLVAGAIDAVQHPFNLLLAALPFPLAFKLWDLLSFVLAASGSYAWARRLGRTRTASVAMGLGFALSGALVGSSDNLTYLTTLATVPWVFAAGHRWLENPGPGTLCLVGLASWLCAAGGDPQAWGFAVALLVVYPLAFTRRESSWWRNLLRGGQAAAAAVIGAAPIVLPVFAWMPQSSRGETLDPVELLRWNLPPLRLLEFALPHLYRDRPGILTSQLYMTYGGAGQTTAPWVVSIYVGASLLALAVVAAAFSRQARWLLGGAAVFGWMALGPASGAGRVLAHLPVLSGFRYWEKMAVWPSLLLPMAAAIGLDEIAAGRARRRVGTAVAAAGLGMLALDAAGRLVPGALAALAARPDAPAGVAELLAANLLDGLLEAGAVMLVLGVVIAAAQRRLLRLSAEPLLALIVIADLFAANVRGYQLASPLTVAPRSPFGAYLRSQPGLQRALTPFQLDLDRFPSVRQFESEWLQATVMLEPCFNVAERIGNSLPYTGMVPARADRYRRRLLAYRLLPHIGLFGVGWVTAPTSPRSASAIGATAPLEVAMTDPALPAFLLRVPHRERAYLAAELSTVDRRSAMEFAISADPERTSRSVIEAAVPTSYRPPAGSTRIAVDEAERVAVETESDGPALLVLNDVFTTGWTATVDGSPATILPANYLARGVWVDAGTHRVEFRYRTPLLREGWAVFLAGGVAAAVASLLRRKHRPGSSDERQRTTA